MKKLLISMIVLLSLFSQDLKFSEFKIATIAPGDIDQGLYIGLSTGALFDANLGYQVELGYFNKTFRDQKKVYNDTTKETDISTEIEESSTYIPLMLKFNYVKELGTTFLLKADLGIGYGLLWISDENFIKNTSSSRFFSGFLWQLGADIGLQISSTGSIYGGFFYNGGAFTTETQEKAGLPSYTEKDMGGLGFRLTVRIDGLGLL